MSERCALMHKLLALLQISSSECSHREHEGGKPLVPRVPFPPSDLECFCREGHRTLDIALPKRRVGDASSEWADVLLFVGGPKELEGTHVFRLGPVVAVDKGQCNPASTKGARVNARLYR